MKTSRPGSARQRFRLPALLSLVSSLLLVLAGTARAQSFDVSLTVGAESLADTGWDVWPLVFLATGLLAAGVSLLARTRRRPASRPAE